MKTNKIIIILLIILWTTTSCKKTKLTGDYSGLAGTWTWFDGWQDGGNTNNKLDLLEKGNYKLYNGSTKIDFGRLVLKNNTWTFISDRIFHKDHFSYNGANILSFKNDTLMISSNHITDQPTSFYVKK